MSVTLLSGPPSRGASSGAACRWPLTKTQLIYGRTRPTRIVGMNEVLLAPMKTFISAYRNRRTPCFHDWSTDGCSAPLVKPEPMFSRPCFRHDWGYRTLRSADKRYGRGSIWNEPNKAAVDTRFLYDMRLECKVRHLSFFQDTNCKNKASMYYLAVAKYHGSFDTYTDWVEYLIPLD